MPKYVLLVFFMILNLNSNAQILVRDGNCYLFEGERICDSDTIEQILSTNMNALSLYLKSKSSAKKADYFGFSALGGIAVSGLLIWHSSRVKKPNPAPFTIGIGVGIVSCALGSFGIGNVVKHVRESEKAINAFNGDSFGYVNPDNSIIISYGYVDNGVGIRLNF